MTSKTLKDLTNKKFGRLTVLNIDTENYVRYSNAYWLCKCDCGNKKIVSGNRLRTGISKSCGCLSKELSRERLSLITKTINDKGYKKHKLYYAWNAMKQRCSNPNNKSYKYYGGRGITVCERWLNFALFVEDVYPSYKEGLTLDRFPNNDGNYEPGNFRWATRSQQSSNQKKRKFVKRKKIIN